MKVRHMQCTAGLFSCPLPCMAWKTCDFKTGWYLIDKWHFHTFVCFIYFIFCFCCFAPYMYSWHAEAWESHVYNAPTMPKQCHKFAWWQAGDLPEEAAAPDPPVPISLQHWHLHITPHTTTLEFACPVLSTSRSNPHSSQSSNRHPSYFGCDSQHARTGTRSHKAQWNKQSCKYINGSFSFHGKSRANF